MNKKELSGGLPSDWAAFSTLRRAVSMFYGCASPSFCKLPRRTRSGRAHFLPDEKRRGARDQANSRGEVMQAERYAGEERARSGDLNVEPDGLC